MQRDEFESTGGKSIWWLDSTLELASSQISYIVFPIWTKISKLQSAFLMFISSATVNSRQQVFGWFKLKLFAVYTSGACFASVWTTSDLVVSMQPYS